MNAVISAALAELRRRKLQTFIIALVVLLTSGAATLALSLLVETDAPYDHAFARANGAHLTVVYDSAHLTVAQVRATAHVSSVLQSAGPWSQLEAIYTAEVPNGQVAGGLTIVGRASPNTAVDRLTIESGRWARGPGEIVVSRHL